MSKGIQIYFILCLGVTHSLPVPVYGNIVLKYSGNSMSSLRVICLGASHFFMLRHLNNVILVYCWMWHVFGYGYVS